jgi:alkyl sulfatase BDS1-like metallo-beta-lactamase superfamily hydrolase
MVLAAAAQAAGPDEGASAATHAANAAALAALPADAEDEDFAARGFLASSTEATIKDAAGRAVWNFPAYDFVEGPAPDTVDPSLWRHAGLLARHGLFKAHERIFQVRGFDIANMSIILGRTGLILVDPLTSVETARAALALARATLGALPVVAVIYTHSHADHFAGVKGVVDPADVAAGRVRIIAPHGFLEHAVSENVIAGNAMTRRAAYQFGTALEPGPEEQMTSGIGRAVAGGTRSLIAPTESVAATGETRTIDGVRFVFQLTPGTEAPAEMNFYLPEMRALCLAENANVTMHNVLTPRGALVRDAKDWADSMTETLRLFGGQADVMFASHGWPRFGADRIDDFVASHRDAYKYLHDQSVRLMNMGLTGEEIAEQIALPKPLAERWFNRGYYGTMRHNSRAVYQRYMGWYDGNPASLDILPKATTAPRYVDAMGGGRKVMKLARAAYDRGDYRWAAELLDRLVFAEPRNAEARAALADAHEQSAFQAESAIWRNMYLMAARELKSGIAAGAGPTVSLDFIAATPTSMLFDLLAVRLDPDAALAAPMTINFVLTDRKETVGVTIRNGVLVHESGAARLKPDATVRLTRPQFLYSMLNPAAAAAPAPSGSPAAAAASQIAPPQVEGSAAAWEKFRTLFAAPDPDFPIVTP